MTQNKIFGINLDENNVCKFGEYKDNILDITWLDILCVRSRTFIGSEYLTDLLDMEPQSVSDH